MNFSRLIVRLNNKNVTYFNIKYTIILINVILFIESWWNVPKFDFDKFKTVLFYILAILIAIILIILSFYAFIFLIFLGLVIFLVMFFKRKFGKIKPYKTNKQKTVIIDIEE